MRASNQDQTLTLTGGDGSGKAGITAFYQLNLNAHGGGSTSPHVGEANISFSVVEAVKMVINAQGIGIGTSPSTKALLVVNGTGTNMNNLTYGYLNSQGRVGLVSPAAGNWVNYSIWASSRIATAELNVFSDERIKNIRGRSDGAADLRTLLGIEVTDYHYKDVIGKGNNPYKKVIAQQVEKVFPQAVSKHIDVVPDIYRRASCTDGWVWLATGLKKGDRVRLIADQAEGVYEVLEVAEDKFRTDFKPEGDKVFVFGREVDDFRTLDYDAIAMLNVSATQQLKKEKDEEVEALRAESAELKAANDALIKRLQILESKMEAALNRAVKAASGSGLKQ